MAPHDYTASSNIAGYEIESHDGEMPHADDYIYLASPFSGTKEQRADRERHARLATKAMVQAGLLVYSPIVHSAQLDAFGDRCTYEQWRRTDEAMIDRLDLVVVLQIPGWDKSKGVSEEIRHAEEIGIPVYYMSPAGE